jgi:hypothetical protein
VPRRLLPLLSVTACAAALLPALPASATPAATASTAPASTPAASTPAASAEPISTTIERGGVTLAFTRSTVTAAWPFALAEAPERTSARFDLNGDGVDELIVGVTMNAPTGGERSALLVRYANGTVERVVREGQGFARELSVADFDGDGFNDVAAADGTALWVFDGGADGLRPTSAVRLTPASPGMPAGMGPLGGPQAVGDITTDGYVDLALGQSNDKVGALGLAGAVAVLRGGPDGLTGAGSARFTQATAGVPGDPAESDFFGTSVAIGNVTGDAHLDLVVGAKGDGGVESSGSVTVLPGTAGGITGTSATMVLAATLDTLALRVRELGSAVTIAEVTGDGRADVVAAAHHSNVAGRDLAGAAVVLAGSPTGIAADRRKIWQRDTAGVPGDAGTGDTFAESVAVGDVTGDGRADVLVGAVHVGRADGVEHGAVTVLPNSPAGLTATGSAEIPGGSWFGLGVQPAELTGGGPREVLIAGSRTLQLFRTVDGTVTLVRSVTASTFGAADLPIFTIGEVLPGGVPVPVPGATPVVPPATGAPKPVRSRFDLDGDGRDEVVVGTSDGAIIRYSGSGRHDQVTARWGSSSRSMTFAAGDFNGDGYADLAAGVPDADRDKTSLRDQGGVWVCDGSAAGLDYGSCRYLSQDSPGMPETSENDDHFGGALAAGDLNGDGRADLAVGAPGERVGTIAAAGAVTVLYGSPTGLTTAAATLLTQNLASIPDAPQRDDQFGAALAIGDVTGDRKADLAITSLGEKGAGSVTLIKGAVKVLATTGAATVHYRDLKLPAGGAEFGAALLIADLDKDGRAEVVAGVPEAMVRAGVGGGAVITLKGTAAGISKAGFRMISQDTAGVPALSVTGDRFGASLAAGDVTGDGYADLLVGAPDKPINKVRQAGTVTLLKGGRTGLTGTGSTNYFQTLDTVPDRSEGFDHFGAAVSILDLDGTAALDAFVGAPEEHVATEPNQVAEGSVTEFVSAKGSLAATVAWNPVTLAEKYGGSNWSRYLGRNVLAS